VIIFLRNLIYAQPARGDFEGGMTELAIAALKEDFLCVF